MRPAALLAAVGCAGPSAAPRGVTYLEDVKPILDARCVSCHAEGGLAPFPLDDWADAHAVHELVGAAVDAGTMPPWLAGEGCNTYRGDPSLDPEEIATVLAWVDAGGPEGRVATASPEEDAIGLDRVDLALELAEPYTPSAEAEDDYRCFLVDWPETDEAYVTGFRAQPGNRAAVHHIIAYLAEPEAADAFAGLDAADPGPGYTCFGLPGTEEVLMSSGLRSLGWWAPGNVGGEFPDGTGVEVRPGSQLVVQVHYTTLAEPLPDRTTLELRVDREVERVLDDGALLNPLWAFGGMPIPPGGAVHRYETPIVLGLTTPPPFLVRGVALHLHLLGRRGRVWIERADGGTECLLDVPRWDFGWQDMFWLETPARLEPGDQLAIECAWDNPTSAEVNWGEGTADEMCLAGVYVTAP